MLGQHSPAQARFRDALLRLGFVRRPPEGRQETWLHTSSMVTLSLCSATSCRLRRDAPPFLRHLSSRGRTTESILDDLLDKIERALADAR